MSYRDIIDIPRLDWTPWEERFRHPHTADAQGQFVNPGLKAGRPNIEAMALNRLTHRSPGCAGSWWKKGTNKEGQQIVLCSKCRAVRIAKL